MKILMIISTVSISAAMVMAHAETPEHGHDKSHRAMEIPSASQMKYAGHGVLKAVKENKVQITHEPIAELKWPAMTMWFGLRNALPQAIRVGDRVRFEMMQAETGQWVIVRIERQ